MAEETISLSKVIKYAGVTDSQSRKAKVISVRNILGTHTEEFDGDIQEKQIGLLEREKLIEAANGEAQLILKSARDEAKRMEEEVSSLRSHWEQEKELLQQEAYEQAFLQGLDEGRQNGLQEFKHQISEARGVITNAKDDYYLHIAKAERVILELGMKTAERVIGRKLEEDPEIFLDIVKRGIKEVRDLPEVQVHVHPSNYKLLSGNQEEIESLFPVLRKLLLYPDDELSQHECFIETGEGRVIVSVDSQLREIKNKLVEILEGESE
ncbi:flagellar assembly protein FliH [Rossellomorea vietnamensis]|uniref:Flagellar assembly protein FliH n=1 Tax=Rossellomorea vietnamensis TaxID=218284 RepID=A0A5D4KJQ2_9BACI|nr:flagellar assembly protein FliH [Rossellomorea vietnamensis]